MILALESSALGSLYFLFLQMGVSGAKYIGRGEAKAFFGSPNVSEEAGLQCIKPVKLWRRYLPASPTSACVGRFKLTLDLSVKEKLWVSVSCMDV